MGKVVFDITVSLDGFVAGPNHSPELPMGEGGMRLFDQLGPEQIELERTQANNAKKFVHMTFRVIK